MVIVGTQLFICNMLMLCFFAELCSLLHCLLHLRQNAAVADFCPKLHYSFSVFCPGQFSLLCLPTHLQLTTQYICVVIGEAFSLQHSTFSSCLVRLFPPPMLQVLKPGTYQVQLMYTSQVQASFKLSVGQYSKIQDGTAKSLRARLPVNVSKLSQHYLNLTEFNLFT